MSDKPELREVIENRQVLEPLLNEVESLTQKIKDSDREIEQIGRNDYPETALLQQVGGVGPLIALTFILTIEDKDRFQKSRDIGCYVGLRPRRSDSGQSQPQLRITKEGDPYLRTMLVQGAHYIISRRGPDTDLKRWGPLPGETRWKAWQEESGCGGCAKTRDPASSAVGNR